MTKGIEKEEGEEEITNKVDKNEEVGEEGLLKRTRVTINMTTAQHCNTVCDDRMNNTNDNMNITGDKYDDSTDKHEC
uniref:Uncharacterized protein n=1 Tax=Onchocerca volvulus TaxID=6282 RepID=A0A8R1TSB8_ONCVO